MSKADILKHKPKTDYSTAKENLKRLQALPLEQKLQLTERRIQEFYDYYNGQVYVSFSGGKDSTVLYMITKKMGLDIPAVFVNTGLEYPEIVDFVYWLRGNGNQIVELRPKMPFNKVLEKCGYPVIGKRQARFIRDLQNANENNKATVNLRLTGMNRKGEYCPTMKLADKWLFMKDAPFKISEQCCDVMKKVPFKRYHKESGRYPITGQMTQESSERTRIYLQYGCNMFGIKQPKSNPMSFWTDQDIWEFIRKYNTPYSKIYDMGETRTGCMFCLFGLFAEKSPTRFDRMAVTHPKQYKYCMEKLGLREVIDYVNNGSQTQLNFKEEKNE